MDPELEAFHRDLMLEATAQATARGEVTRTALISDLANRLVQAEELQDWVPCYHDSVACGRPIGLDGYSSDDLEIDGTIHVLIGVFMLEPELGPLSTRQASAGVERAVSFLEAALNDHLDLEPSTPAADFSLLLQRSREELRAVRVIVLSNGLVGKGFRPSVGTSVGGVRVDVHVWDLKKFKILSESGGREDTEIDFTALSLGGLPVLSAGIGVTNYSAYLCVVPGNVLAEIYDRLGSRVLEGNVRAFLSTRGRVNRGILSTIRKKPELFFAFNNGITATASEVDLGTVHGELRLLRVRGLQIVNGGQTTASLFNARVRDRLPLNAVFVQMKLSVLPSGEAQTLTPEISRYANTQNKVSDADLFANHPFHRCLESLSRRILAPAPAGSVQLTRWFYERARAQYQSEQMRLSPSETKAFILLNPKHQMITKTDLAKFENSWAGLPHLVSRGAQKNFVSYAEVVCEHFEKKPSSFNERWFQHVIARAILFRATELVVSRAPWYSGSYRANIVTYTVARLRQFIAEEFPGQVLDLDRIWKHQALSAPVAKQIEVIAEAVLQVLISPPPGFMNVTEWAKKEACLKAVSMTPIEAVEGIEEYLISEEEEASEKRVARSEARETKALDAKIEVINRHEAGYWRRAVAALGAFGRGLSQMEYTLVHEAAKGHVLRLTDRQAKALLEAAMKLEGEGFE